MALTYSPFGIISDDMQIAAGWNAKVNQTYQIDPTDTTVIKFGDPVTMIGGFIKKYTGAMQTANVPILGSFIGCEYQPTSGYITFFQYWGGVNDVVTGGKISCSIEDSPVTEFKIVANATSGVVLSQTLLNANFDYSEEPGIFNTSVVGMAVPAVTTTNFSLKVLGVYDSATYTEINQFSTTGPNAVICPFPTLLVKINNHMFAAGTPGAPATFP